MGCIHLIESASLGNYCRRRAAVARSIASPGRSSFVLLLFLLLFLSFFLSLVGFVAVLSHPIARDDATRQTLKNRHYSDVDEVDTQSQ